MKNIIAACIIAIALIVSANIIHSSLKSLGTQMDQGFASIANKNEILVRTNGNPVEIAGPANTAYPTVKVHMTADK
jgi:hypothetical protein